MDFIGILYLFILFAASFVFVHMIRLAYLGFKSAKRKNQPKPEQPKKEEKPQPVYYIVEKKRAKRNYSKPREIEFKEEK